MCTQFPLVVEDPGCALMCVCVCVCVCVCAYVCFSCPYISIGQGISLTIHTTTCIYIRATNVLAPKKKTYLTTFTPCKCPLYVCMHAFRRMSHIFRLVSSEPDAKKAPKGWKSTARQSLRCPTRVRIVLAWSRSHSLMVPLVDPATTTSSWWMMRFGRSARWMC